MIFPVPNPCKKFRIRPDPDPVGFETLVLPRSRLTEYRSESVLAGRFHSSQNVLRRSVLWENGQF
jgi:hypothetical protein